MGKEKVNMPKKAPYIYEVKIVLDPQWYENSLEQSDVKEYLDSWINTHLGFRGTLHSSEIKETKQASEKSSV